MYITSKLKSAFAIVLLACVQWGQAYAEQLPVEHFAKLPVVSKPVISPDGKRIAMRVVSKGKPVVVVQVLDKTLENQETGKISVGAQHIRDYLWANNERLILAVRDSDKHKGNIYNVTRLMAIDWDGKNPVTFEMQPNQWGYYRRSPKILHSLPTDNDHVLAILDDKKDSRARPHVHKVNVYTGKKSLHQPSYMSVQKWHADQDGNVLVGQKFGTKGSTEATTYYRANEGDQWKVLQRSDYFESERLIPYRIREEKENVLLLSTRSSDQDAWKTPDETVLDLYEYDMNQGKITGKYKNEKLAATKAKVQALLPGLKVSYRSSDLNKERYIFAAFSDTKPRTYYLYLEDQNQLMQLGREYPELDGKVTATMQAYEYKARDGLTIPAFLTKPAEETTNKLPLVVYPHLGSRTHDRWGFDSRVQFFANRGFAVFQPQFRGSTGYGLDHEEAGYGEWGAAIQDDITDGVLDLINKGVVDKNRICIVGGRFGGYSAAMGLVKTPNLYSCAVSINGVMDFPKYMNDFSDVLFSAIRKMPKSANNPEAFSPYHNTKAITAPLLLIAGKKDTIVPYQHSADMYKRLKQEGKDVNYIEFKDGEHWPTNEANEIEAWKAIDNFLADHLAN